MNVGRVIGTAVLGFLFLLFLVLDLVLFGVLPLNSMMVTVLPLLGLLGGAAIGVLTGKRNAAG